MTGNNNLDERQKNILGNSMAIAAIIAFVYEIGIITYTFLNTGSIKTTYTEMILVVIMILYAIVYYIATDRSDNSIEKVIKGKRKVKVDEREKSRRIASLGMAGIIAMIYSFGVIIFRFIQTRKFQSSYFFIGLVVLITVSITLYHIINKEYDVPKTIFGKRLPLGDSKESKKVRIIYYIKDALRLATVFIIIDIMNPDRLTFSIPSIDWKYMPYIADYLARFILFLIINYVWGEFNIRKQRKFDKSLEDDNVEDL